MACHLAFLSVGVIVELQMNCGIGQGPVQVAAVSDNIVDVLYLLVSAPFYV